MNISKYVKIVRVILFLFLIFELILAFITYIVNVSGVMSTSFDKRQKGIFLLILIIISIISYHKSNKLHNKLMIKIRNYSNIDKKLKEYRNTVIIRAFILNIIPFMAFFIFMFTGQYLLLIFGIIMTIYFFKILYPQTGKLLKSMNNNINNENS